MNYLTFISDENLIKATGAVIKAIQTAELNINKSLHKNVIDPFSALFHGLTHNLKPQEWLKQEKARQIQKTMQNAIGTFHQEILGAANGWENLGFAGGLDIVNHEQKILAEIKNKFNTTKGNHKIEIYDAINEMLGRPNYENFIGYYVEIIPQGKQKYDKPFVPSDSKIKEKRPINNKIRVIDGMSFYELVTGNAFALQELFEVLPQVLSDHYEYIFDKNASIEYFSLFEKAFSVE